MDEKDVKEIEEVFKHHYHPFSRAHCLSDQTDHIDALNDLTEVKFFNLVNNNTCNRCFFGRYGDLHQDYDKYILSHIGYNLKATDIQAAMGVEQLKKLDWFCAARRENFKRWTGGF